MCMQKPEKKIWNPSKCTCQNDKYLEIVTDDEIIEKTKTVSTKNISAKILLASFNREKVTCKIKNFYIVLAFVVNYHIIIDNC